MQWIPKDRPTADSLADAVRALARQHLEVEARELADFAARLTSPGGATAALGRVHIPAIVAARGDVARSILYMLDGPPPPATPVAPEELYTVPQVVEELRVQLLSKVSAVSHGGPGSTPEALVRDARLVALSEAHGDLSAMASVVYGLTGGR
jgi:hypothetical protein